MTSALELRGVSVESSHGVSIISDVSLVLSAGRITGLVGESGSGKSTTALAALGHSRRGVRITAGVVNLHGEDLLSLPAAQLRERRGKVIAYVPQHPPNTLNPSLNIGRHLSEIGREHLGSSDELSTLIPETLEHVHLPSDQGFLRRYPHQLSGGQQQRVVLALAFICRPSVVVLDEPTTGLDVTTQRHILQTIRRLCEELDTASLYVSHDLAVVGQLADDVAVMYAGRIVERASAQRLFGAAAHPYSRALLSAVPDVDGTVEARGLAGTAPPPGKRPSGCAFWPRCEFVIDECRLALPDDAYVHYYKYGKCYRVY
jgi:peptide/nickel transport system ATP-binding protein